MRLRHKKYGFEAEWIATTTTNYFIFDVGEIRGCEPMHDFEVIET
jgi:hypothetical protein